MNYEEARNYVVNCGKNIIVPGLDNVRTLCSLLGNPQDKLKIIHIAGTNGKGSVGAFIEQILLDAGLSVGRFSSPAVFDYREQFRVNKLNISKEDYAVCMKQMRNCVDKMKNKPTTFEIETALSFLYFSKKNCDYVLTEVGMGGREDATNVICKSVMSVITPIGVDHTKFLGINIKDIAYQKAGIIKTGGVVVTSHQEDCVMDVINSECEKCDAKLFVADGKTENEISLLGEYQRENAYVAERTAELLGIDEKYIKSGLKNTVWSGRFEKICDEPTFILDGTHNKEGAIRLVESIKKYYPNKKIIYIMGVFADKPYDEIAKLTAPLAEEIYTITPNNPRALKNTLLADTVKKYNDRVKAVKVAQAVKMCLSEHDCVTVAFGSLSFLGQVKKSVDDIVEMRKCNAILKNAKFIATMSEIENAERDRIYCKHDTEHLLSVARGAYILSLENGLRIPKYMIYSASLLHDIGRYEQYKNGIEHHIAGENIAREVLEECNFSADEIKTITDAVGSHKEVPEQIETLCDVIAVADKRTRMCMMCDATDTCNWCLQDRNNDILI